MKHYRILEKKSINGSTTGNIIEKKQYTIQFSQNFAFGLNYWKNYDNNTYYKYDDALKEIKKIIKQEDYETSEFGYHYIDAYKIFKYKDKK